MASEDTKYSQVAAIFGVTGMVGRELARMLLSTSDWKVYGVARCPEEGKETEQECPGYRFVSCDLLSPVEAQEKLSLMKDVTHVFWITWSARFPPFSIECYDDNKAMMANALNAILPNAKGLRHFSLQTGAKHYISLTGALENNKVELYNEESPRVATGHNFYYALEDMLQERLPSRNVAWSIQRPGLIMGCSRRAFYNIVGSISVYGSICKHLNLPFVFGGSRHCWEETYMDGSDARLVAEQHIWAATSTDDHTTGQAFNAVNGEPFTWKAIWSTIGEKLGVEGDKCMLAEDFVFSMAMVGKEDVWKEIVEKHGLVTSNMEDLAKWDFLDVLFRYPMKMLLSRKKIDKMGFKKRYNVLDSILYWIDVMRTEKYIP